MEGRERCALGPLSHFAPAISFPTVQHPNVLLHTQHPSVLLTPSTLKFFALHRRERDRVTVKVVRC
jgi:hypothetical protein